MKEKRIIRLILAASVTAILLSGCATIVGGSNYNAHVNIPAHPEAKIYKNGALIGSGYANLQIPRIDANKVTFEVKQPNCKDQKFEFTQKTFRGWAFAGTVVGWTGVINGIPLPWGIVVDGLSGAFWKPNITEKGVTQSNYKNFNYTLEYNGCPQNTTPQPTVMQEPTKDKLEKLKTLKGLLDDGTLNANEFEQEKQKILNEN